MARPSCSACTVLRCWARCPIERTGRGAPRPGRRAATPSRRERGSRRPFLQSTGGRAARRSVWAARVRGLLRRRGEPDARSRLPRGMAQAAAPARGVRPRPGGADDLLGRSRVVTPCTSEPQERRVMPIQQLAERSRVASEGAGDECAVVHGSRRTREFAVARAAAPVDSRPDVFGSEYVVRSGPDTVPSGMRRLSGRHRDARALAEGPA